MVFTSPLTTGGTSSARSEHSNPSGCAHKAAKAALLWRWRHKNRESCHPETTAPRYPPPGNPVDANYLAGATWPELPGFQTFNRYRDGRETRDTAAPPRKRVCVICLRLLGDLAPSPPRARKGPAAAVIIQWAESASRLRFRGNWGDRKAAAGGTALACSCATTFRPVLAEQRRRRP
jgi:hypothetical protein